VFALCGLLAAVTPLVPAVAGQRQAAVLIEGDSVMRWSGEFTAAATAVVAPPDPLLCGTTPACDDITVDVAAPPDNWVGRPGGLLVAIDWPALDAGYDLDLYVYRAGGRFPVASSTSTAFSRHEAAWVANPPADRYHVIVTAKSVVGQPVLPGALSTLSYRGAARIERGLTVDRTETNLGEAFTRRFVAFDRTVPDGTPLLPDVIPTTPAGFHLESGWGAQYYFYGDRGVRHQPSCYPQETVGATADAPRPAVGPLRCLRWDQGEANAGDGPLELHNYPYESDGYDMWQRVYASDGSVTQRPVGDAWFSAQHGHLHYLGFTVATLHTIREDGTPGVEVARSPDKGICLADVAVVHLGDDRTSPLSYGVPGTCDAAGHSDPRDPTYPGSPYFAMGISVGAADVYPWYIADQYLDVTRVPDGRYLLRVEIDADHKLLEKTHTNNVAVACVELRSQQANPC